jgi:diguanylate cyclase (GGDEF)-like protein
VLAEGEPLLVTRPRDRRGTVPLVPRALGLRDGEACLVVPLRAEGQAVGALVLSADLPDAFPAEAPALLTPLADRAAGVLARAHRFKQSEALAHTDPLTGLVNRRRFDERLAEALTGAVGIRAPFSLVLADLDHFKRVNDTYGHPAGDAVLVELARRLEARRRADDTLARLGGEEFALLVARADKAGATAAAERVRRDIGARPFVLDDGVRLDLTVSLGVATYPDDGGDAATLLARADEALYRAKHGGRDRVCVAGAVLAPPARAAAPAPGEGVPA